MNKLKNEQGKVQHKNPARHLMEGGFILTLGLSIFLLLALFSYNADDPGWSSIGGDSEQVLNAAGKIGAYIADLFYWFFGYAAFLLPVFITYAAAIGMLEGRNFATIDKTAAVMRMVGLILLLISSCAFLSLQLSSKAWLEIQLSGGVIGQFLAINFNNALNLYGSLLLLFSMFLVGLTWLTGLSWLRVIEIIGRTSIVIYKKLLKNLFLILQAAFVSISAGLKTIGSRISALKSKKLVKVDVKTVKDKQKTSILKRPKKAKLEPRLITDLESKPTKTESKKKVGTVKKQQANSGGLPGLGLLDKGDPGKPMGGYSNQELEDLSREVEQNLLDFGVNVNVVSVHPGPVITRFELQLAAGVKASRLTALAKDLARSLSVTSVRVVEIIPGKTVVGIELPNPNRVMVRLEEVLSSNIYQKANSALSLALGVDIAGQPMVVDLAKMPHLLVAGTTGSGKSVGINAMILSLLFQASPEEVRLILVDPKMLELSVYDGIPHLLTPVVTDMREAQSALRWCVGEMERRYKLMAAVGVRNLSGYNTVVKEAREKGAPLKDPLWKQTDSMDDEAPELSELPYIVVVIDELADMMMVVGKKVEQLIARIAQKARAAGIHLILATQRPSVDVLTGLIKSNIPTRISFQVSSKIDSRTILDQQGAEQLLGHGDMLFLAPGTGAPLRVHGAFVDDKEVHRIADDWRGRGTPDYIESITQHTDDGADGDGFGEERGNVEEKDPLYDQAVEFVIQTRKASISSVQRRFKIGYNRAARLVEEMERTGLVGPLEGGVRDVLAPSGE